MPRRNLPKSRPWRHLYSTVRWFKLRSKVLKQEPLCRMCHPPGLNLEPPIRSSEIVDHIRPHKGDPRLFWDRRNLQGLCKRCHDRHKQAQERMEEIDGFSREIGADGYPVDPKHPFNR